MRADKPGPHAGDQPRRHAGFHGSSLAAAGSTPVGQVDLTSDVWPGCARNARSSALIHFVFRNPQKPGGPCRAFGALGAYKKTSRKEFRQRVQKDRPLMADGAG